jgi:hypothetical protein
MMHLGPNKLTISKLDNMKLREITGTNRSNLNSKQEQELNQNERYKDTRFLSEVRPPTKDVYVSIVGLTKSRVSFNHNPFRTIIKI